MKKIISQLYELPLHYYIILIITVLSVWTLMAIANERKRFWRRFNLIALIITVAVIILVTLAFRRTEAKGLSMIPFSSFELAQTHSDIYLEMMLNVVLFFPVGLTMPFVMNGIVKRPIITTLLSAIALSTVIEVMQYILMRGYAEIDDVIFNTVGVLLGCISYIISAAINAKRINHRE